MKKNRKIGLIPARSGSKGLPNKNVQKIGDETLIEIAVKNAMNSNVFDVVVFTSDSSEYLEIIQKAFGMDDRLLLHKRITGHGDNDEVDAMIVEVLEGVFGKEELDVALLYPTSPGRSSEIIAAAMKKYEICTSHKPLVSVTSFYDYIWTNHPYVFPLNYNPRRRESRQKHKNVYYKENKSIYIFNSNFLKETKTRIYDSPILFEMPSELSIDIDMIEDLQFYKLINEK